MSNKHVFLGIRTSFTQQPSRRGLLKTGLVLACTLFGAAATPAVASASSSGAPNCAEVYDPNAAYPALPDVEGPDVSGEAGVVVYLHEDRAVVELGGCFYEADRPLVVDFAGLDFMTLLIELPEHREDAQVHVTEDGEWAETLEVSDPMFSYVIGPDHSLGFELAPPDAAAPTGPVIVTKPTGGNPDPD